MQHRSYVAMAMWPHLFGGLAIAGGLLVLVLTQVAGIGFFNYGFVVGYALVLVGGGILTIATLFD